MLRPSVTMKMVIKDNLFLSNIFDVCLYLYVLRSLLSDTSESGGQGRCARQGRGVAAIKSTLSSTSIREREGDREPREVNARKESHILKAGQEIGHSKLSCVSFSKRGLVHNLSYETCE